MRTLRTKGLLASFRNFCRSPFILPQPAGRRARWSLLSLLVLKAFQVIDVAIELTADGGQVPRHLVHGESAIWLHKAREMPQQQFKYEVEKVYLV